jgi:thymidylate synthase|tara:strand:- start:2626 stop:3309 length:684 start_codon:yes stop_codon:yes gene_type:complete
MKLNSVHDIREFFKGELKDGEFTIDKTGQKTIELLGASFIASEPAIFGTPSQEYIEKELAWYQSQSTNIYDINGVDSDAPPAAWQYAANKHGEINSNYGHLIWSDKYYNQYGHVLDELLNNPDGRRASMIYNRPSIWMEFDENGKSDFICTNAVTYYIRDNILHCVVQMRSNDVIFGYKNDYAWQFSILNQLCDEYNNLTMAGIEVGHMIWQVQNLHVYERHFNLVK